MLKYHITPHTTTGQSPAEMLMGRKLRSRLDLVKPDLEHKVHTKQQEQKSNHDKKTKAREFYIGDAVYARNFARGAKWLSGQIVGKQSSILYEIEMLDGRVWRRHTDHLIYRSGSNVDDQVEKTSTDTPIIHPQDVVVPEGEGINVEQEIDVEQPVAQIQQPQQNVRRSHREIKPPNRYGFD